jgi:hypothetical protein
MPGSLETGGDFRRAMNLIGTPSVVLIALSVSIMDWNWAARLRS